jgi:hypothetical protein
MHLRTSIQGNYFRGFSAAKPSVFYSNILESLLIEGPEKLQFNLKSNWETAPTGRILKGRTIKAIPFQK